MPEKEAKETQVGGEDARGALRLNLERAQTNYSNIAVVTVTPEELILNFGLSTARPTPQNAIMVEVSNRTVMSYPAAKRLTMMLSNVIRRYEAAHGVIDIGGPLPADADSKK